MTYAQQFTVRDSDGGHAVYRGDELMAEAGRVVVRGDVVVEREPGRMRVAASSGKLGLSVEGGTATIRKDSPYARGAGL